MSLGNLWNNTVSSVISISSVHPLFLMFLMTCSVPWATTQWNITCAMCSGSCRHFRHLSYPSLALLSFSCVHSVLSSTCSQVHLMFGGNADLYTFTNAPMNSSLLIWVIQASVYILWEGGTSPCGHSSLSALRNRSFAAEQPFFYLVIIDFILNYVI